MGVLNVAGYFDPLLALLNHGISEQFVRSNHLELLLVTDDAEAVVSDLIARLPAASHRERSDFERT